MASGTGPESVASDRDHGAQADLSEVGQYLPLALIWFFIRHDRRINPTLTW